MEITEEKKQKILEAVKAGESLAQAARAWHVPATSLGRNQHMSRIGALLCLTVLFSFRALAQEVPRAELFGGYSLLRPGSLFERQVKHGWNAALTVPVTKWLGITSDFDGFYKSSQASLVTPFSNRLLAYDYKQTFHSFLFGPQFSWRRHPRITPFGQLLIGVGYRTIRVENRGPVPPLIESPFVSNFSDSGFAAAAGGGVDLKLSDKFTYRLFQADYLNDQADLGTRNNFRFATGIVFRFGKK